jgi:hypothetical protein
MNKHMRYIVEEWLPTLDDAGLQGLADATSGTWDDAPSRRLSKAGSGCLICIVTGDRYRDAVVAGAHIEAEKAYWRLRERAGAWTRYTPTPRSVTDPIRAEARRLLAARRLAIDVPVASVV